MADFQISDGSPWWMSPDIIVRNDPSEDYNLFTDVPVTGGHQDPVEGQDNVIYVRVYQVGALGTNQPGKLNVYVARGGPEFHPDTLECVAPGTNWSTVSDNHVVRVPFTVNEMGSDHEYDVLDMSVHEGFPGTGTSGTGWRWYRFLWKAALVPPDGETLGWHPCLLAWMQTDAQDPHYDPTAAVSADPDTDNNFAQRNLTVIHATKTKAITRSVVLGNRKSLERRIGLVVRISGTAAPGASVTLRFRTKQKVKVVDRIAIPARLPEPVKAPTSTWYRRLRRGSASLELRDAPVAWNVTFERPGFVFTAPEGGLTIPVIAGEVIEAEVEMKPGKKGNQLVVDLAQNDGTGRVLGGVSFDLQY